MKVSEFKEKAAQLQKELMDNALTAVQEEINALFEACPKIKAVGWTQATPSFNDGDPCIFTVSDPCFLLEDDCYISAEECGAVPSCEDMVWCWDQYEVEFSDEGEAVFNSKEVEDFVNTLFRGEGSDDILKAAFSDGQQIKVTREGVSLEEYWEC